MGQPYKIKHGLVVADEVIKVTGHDKKAYYNGNELTTEVRLSSEINTLSTEVNTRIDNLDATHTADIAQIRLELDNLEMDTTAYIDGRVNILETQVNINTTNIGDLNQLIIDSTDLVQAINQGSGKVVYIKHADVWPNYEEPNDRYVIEDDVTTLIVAGNEANFCCEIKSSRTKPLELYIDSGGSFLIFADNWDDGQGVPWGGAIVPANTDGIFANYGVTRNTTKEVLSLWGPGWTYIEPTKNPYDYEDDRTVWTIGAMNGPAKSVVLKYPFGVVDNLVSSIPPTFDNPWPNSIAEILNKGEWNVVRGNYSGLSYPTSEGGSMGSNSSTGSFPVPDYYANPYNYNYTINLYGSPTDGRKHNFTILTGGQATINSPSGHDIYEGPSNYGTSLASVSAGDYRFVFNGSLNRWEMTRLSNRFGILTTVGRGNFEFTGIINCNPTKGPDNTYFGWNSVNVISTTGGQNTAIGAHALTTTTSGSHNTALGYKADQLKSNGSRNIAIGSQVSTAATGNDRIAIGYGATSNRDLICAITHSDAGKDYKLTLNASDYPTASTLCYLNEKNNNSLTHGVIIRTDATYLMTAMNRAQRASMQVTNNGIIWAEQVLQGGERTWVDVGSGQTIILNQILGGSGELNTLRMVDTTSNVVSYTLDYSSSEIIWAGVYNTFVDMKGTFNTNPVTITINNQPLEGVAAPNTVILDVDNTITKFVYTGASYGWKRITMLNQ